MPLVVVTLLALASGWHGVSRDASRFDALESAQTDRTERRVKQILSDRWGHLEATGRDWSQWDEPAKWLEGKNPSFPGANLTAATLGILGQDAMVYWDKDLRVRGSLGAAQGGASSAIQERLRGLVAAGMAPCTGPVAIGGELWLATLQPVGPSRTSRPKGWFALARRMDSREDSAIGHLVQLPAWMRMASSREVVGNRVPIGRDSLECSIRLGLLGGGSAVLVFHEDRPLLALRGDVASGFLVHFFFSFLLTLVAMAIVFERVVLHRLDRLVQGVERIHATGGDCPGVADPELDEIGNLSLRIDEMVSGLRQARRKLEDALDDAESAGRARGNFLASMTHELRTPLNGVIGLTEYVLKGELDPERREALELSRGAALGLLETINGVLEYSRLEKGAVELVLEEIDLSAVVLDMAKVVAPIADAKGIDLHVLGDPRFPRRIRADPARIRQVLNNLVGNAVKFTSEGGVVLSVDLEKLDEAGALVRFEVADTGVGIPLERHKAIFDPFEQSSPETAVRFGGTGLGLTIARDLVQAMGGRIAVESLPGEGSLFHFAIRFETPDPRPMIEPVSSPGRGVRIDVSNPKVRDHLHALCSAVGLDVRDDGVLVADTAEKALGASVPSVVISRKSLVRRSRMLLDGVLAEVVALPFGNRAILAAIERMARPRRTIMLLAGGFILREVVRGMLEREGFVVESPGTVQEASARLAADRIDLVVVDLDDPSWGALAGGMPPQVGLAQSPGWEGLVVSKPVKAPQLLSAVHAALEDIRS